MVDVGAGDSVDGAGMTHAEIDKSRSVETSSDLKVSDS